jgi:uncharacterized protein YcbK (DUF882 family)
MIGRRPFLLGSVAAAGGAALPSAWRRASAAAAAAPERWIWARNHAGEEVATAYRSGEAYHPQAVARLRHLFRDLREEVQGPLPPLLVDILSVLQERWGYTRPLLVGSGYRTLKTNFSLEGAAPASFHLRGWAADIRCGASSRATSAWRCGPCPSGSASWGWASTRVRPRGRRPAPRLDPFRLLTAGHPARSPPGGSAAAVMP